jgi:exodeoxyribonuclease V alpha subunit
VTTVQAATPEGATPDPIAVLSPFIEVGLFGSYELQLARTVRRLQPDVSDTALLALAVAARAPRFGHVCSRLDLAALEQADLTDDGSPAPALPWPTAGEWAAALDASAIVATPADATVEPVRPLVWDAGRLYLQRYWHYELAVAEDIHRRATGGERADDPDGPASAVLDVLFGPDAAGHPDLQRRAVLRGLRGGASIIAGGPGTGKTHTVARLLAAATLVAEAQGFDLQVALAAPTGKAAARMGEAVSREVQALSEAGLIEPALAQVLTSTTPTTVHSLLGWRDRTHFQHDRQRPLPHDLVVVDETSMVALPLMARLLDAVKPDAGLVLVGDPFQLASIEAGTVMSDLVGPSGTSGELDEGGEDDDAGSPRPVLAGRVTVLRRMRRFGEDSAIAALAEAIRIGDVEAALALLTQGSTEVSWVDPEGASALDRVKSEVVAAGVDMVSAARAGASDAALAAANRVKVLAATRRGPLGVNDWTAMLEAEVSASVPGFSPGRRWHVGRPVMVTANDPINGVFNGDVGVVVAQGTAMEVALGSSGDVRTLAPSRLDRVETWWAMTIHKSQGSEFDHAVVSLPQAGSPILTRELLYTAVTRARERLTVVGGEESLRAAILRPVARASGLEARLWPSVLSP